MADINQYFKDPTSGQTYISYNDYVHNIGGATPLPQSSNAISPQSLQTASLTPYATVPKTRVPDVSNLFTTPQLTATPEEQQAQGMIDSLIKSNEQLVGKSAYQAKENSVFGVDAAQKTITDLNSQLIRLKNEATSGTLQLQEQGAQNGVATPFVQGKTDSYLRKNAIAALTVSSLMSAAQGQLANALSLADRAVAAKYDPIQEKITATANNLQLILNSPQYSLEQKNRAQAQLDIQNKNQYILDTQRQNTQDTYKIALDAAANGADATTLQKIQNAPTALEAMQAYSDFNAGQTIVQAAKSSKITTPYVLLADGTVANSTTGYKFTSQEDFQQKTGMSTAQAGAQNLISPLNVSTSTLESGDTQIVTANGRSLLVNKLTGETIKDLGAAYKEGSGGSGGGGAPSTTSKIQEVSGYLDSKAGSDGKVSPDDWAAAEKAWVQAGYGTAANFKTTFKIYINPDHAEDYI